MQSVAFVLDVCLSHQLHHLFACGWGDKCIQTPDVSYFLIINFVHLAEVSDETYIAIYTSIFSHIISSLFNQHYSIMT